MDEADKRLATDSDPPAVGVGSTSYEMTLAGLGVSFRWHLVANAIGAACILVLGHPYLAAFALATYCAIDAVHGALRSRWAVGAATADEAAGFRKLAALCVVRMVVYETVALMLVASVVGYAVGAAVVALFGRIGLDLSGFYRDYSAVPGLTGIVYPRLVVANLVGPGVGLFLASVAVSLYPAAPAARLDPSVAIRHT